MGSVADRPARRKGPFSAVLNFLLGRPLAMEEEEEQKVGPLAGVPMLGLDGLGSSSYGPEAALTVLIVIGTAASKHALPVFAVIVGVLLLLYVSYRQVMVVYPEGGGSFTVATDNLGTKAGLVAAAALLIDYVLAVAVGVSAGVGALVSAIPTLHPYMLPLTLAVLTLVTVVNLRGIRESGMAFVVPTYLFILSLAVVMLLGVYKTVTSGGHPEALYRAHHPEQAVGVASLWLLARAFASGCTALTGIEAVSNGMSAFAEPKVRNAQWTLAIIAGSLGSLILGLGVLCRAYGIDAIHQASPHYDSVVSQVVAAVVGRGWFYYIAVFSTIVVLALSANTGFADFPRLCRMLAEDHWLPHAFAHRGRRLVHNVGILIIASLSAILLLVFGGVTDHLIPLFAVGAFLAFTLSQAGMVAYWRRQRVYDFRLFVNVLGTVATGAAVVVILVANFTGGAWISLCAVAGLVVLFTRVRGYYDRAHGETTAVERFEPIEDRPPLMLVAVKRWTRLSEKALRFALSVSPDVMAVHVARDEEETHALVEEWNDCVVPAFAQHGGKPPELRLLYSRYRKLGRTILRLVDELEAKEPNRTYAVVIPELVQTKWWQYLLHNQSALALRTVLFLAGDKRVVVITVPYYLSS